MSEFIKYHKYKNYICEIDINENNNEEINLNGLFFNCLYRLKSTRQLTLL